MRIPLALVLVIGIHSACGGGGGSSSPTAPGPPAPPPPVPTPDLNDTTFFGTVVGLLDPSSSFTGSEVRVVGVGETDVRADNQFFLDGLEPGTYTVVVSGAGHLRRKFRFQMQPGGANEIPSLDLVERSLFNLEAFDEIYRGDNYFIDNGHLHRWVDIPHFVIDRQSFLDLGTNGRQLLSTVLDAIDDELEILTLGLMRDPQRVFRNGLPSINHCAGSLGYLEVQIHAEEANPQYAGTCGSCAFVGYELHQGQITLTSQAFDSTVWHEFGHLLGAGHLEAAAGTSVMRISGPGRSQDFSPMDRYHLQYVYSRPADTVSPDDMSHLDPIVGRVVPVG